MCRYRHIWPCCKVNSDQPSATGVIDLVVTAAEGEAPASRRGRIRPRGAAPRFAPRGYADAAIPAAMTHRSRKRKIAGPEAETPVARPVVSRFFADSPRPASASASDVKRRRQHATDDPGIQRLPPGWCPPRSPYRLIEEWLWHQPWQLLVACILLNKTTGTQVLNHQVLPRIISRWPHPSLLANADVDELEVVLRPLGLHRNRARSLRRFSAEYMFTEWDFPIALHGIGRYADDAFRIFCLGRPDCTHPADKELRKYVKWYRATQMTGTAVSWQFSAAADGTARSVLPEGGAGSTG